MSSTLITAQYKAGSHNFDDAPPCTKAPCIGDNCLIGAGVVIIGDIRIGDNAKIGAGTVISSDIPDNCTVVPQPPRIIEREKEDA